MAAQRPQQMNQRPWTDEQRRAVEARGVSVALSAGAGCGKTFVLTERFLAQLQPHGRTAPGGSELGQLVAITFTERAAREMRDRIRKACRKQLRDAPEEQVSYWLELIRQLDTARISTIHSFCGTLLRGHAVEAGLDPQFRVLDQAQAQTLLYESLDERLRSRLADRSAEVIELVVEFGLEQLYDMIRTLLGRRQEIDWPRWRSETADELLDRWKGYWRTDTVPRVLRQIADSPAADEILKLARREPSVTRNAAMQQRLKFILTRLPTLCESGDPKGELAEIQENAKVQGGGGKRDWDREEAYNRFRDAAEKLRDLIKRVQPRLEFDHQEARPAAETALRLLGVAGDVAQEYDRRKRESRALDFDDLLIRTRELLTGPGRETLRKRLASQIRLLLVDEFQDTDPLQVELVKALCDEELTRGRLFFVGDFKQSIYRFRGAQPHVFRRLRGEIPPEGRLPLTLNFRSQPAVLDFVNALFCDALGANGASGREYEALRPDRPQVSPTPAVEFLWATEPPGGDSTGRPSASEDASSGTAGQAERLRRREADWIARRLRAMLDSPERIVYDGEAARAGEPAARPVAPGDVALLFRALSNVELYEEALRRYGIDYYLVGGHAFYAQQEIFDLLNLLRAISSPCDEVSLAGVLRSPLFSLLDETLFWLARHPGGLSGGLFAEELPTELQTQQRGRVEFAAAVLRELRAIKDRVPTAQLIGEALERTGYDAILLAEFLGERKLANLRKLMEQARSFDRSGIFTLADFITQLSQFVTRQPDEPLAATHPESSKVVRLMTIHQAKGLEFPVVVVPDVDRSRRGPTASVAFTPELGPMVKCRDGNSGFDLHMLAEADEDRAELVRLLYVATTRAADYLILSAGVPELGSAKGPWMELIGRRFDLASGELRTGLPPGYGEPKILVTTSEPPLDGRPPAAGVRPGLAERVEEARQMAERGAGRVPAYLAPVRPDPTARRQYSFSRLTGAMHTRDLSHRADPLQAAEPPAVDPVGLGTLVHAVLAEIDFARPASGYPGDVSAVVRRHAQRHLPDADDELDEPIEMVRRFVASARAAEIVAAEEVYPELEFLLAWPPGNNAEPDGRYLQGFIDCLYRDAAGEWHLVDYKTNRVTAATLGAVAGQYEMQMLLYALAAETILGRPPVELALSFLRPGLEHHFPWNDAARRRVVELVDRAMALHNTP
jgi:ATP-dependent helicase/nuclease subunit A